MNITKHPNNNRLLSLLGASLVSFTMAAFIYAYGPIYNLEYNLKITNKVEAKENPIFEVPSADNSDGAIMEEAAGFGVDSCFSVVIPKLAANSNIILNVDPYNTEEYHEALKKGVAHAYGSSYPGRSGTTYLFAHSTNSAANVTRYNAVFYQLKNLENDDDIIIFFDHKKFLYRVSQKVVVAANDTSWINKSGEERLILQTCDPPGTTWRRLLVIAKPVS